MIDDDINRLKHIKDAIGKIIDVIGDIDQGTYQFKMDNEVEFESIISRNIMIVGEAVFHLSPSVTEQEPAINWENFVSIRNSVVHEYFDVELNKAKIWDCYLDNDMENLYSFAEEVIEIYKLDNHNVPSNSEEKNEPKKDENPSPSFTM